MIDAKIIVYNAVSETTNTVPVNLWKAVFVFLRQPVCGLSNNLKVPNYRINRFAVFGKVFKTLSNCIVEYLAGTLQNIAY